MARRGVARDRSLQSAAQQRTAELRAISHQQTISFHQGPVPAADELAKYNDIIPDAAHRIFVMAENQAAHRIKSETSTLRHDAIARYVGLAIAGMLGVLGIISGVTLGIQGHETTAGILFGTTLIGLVGSFIYGTRSNRQERIEKTRLLTGQDGPG